MKLKLLFFSGLLFSPCLIFAQSAEVKFLIDTTISIMKKDAVSKGSVNWDEIQKEAYLKSAGATSPYAMGSAMRYILQSINDFHGKFFYKDSTFAWSKPRPTTSDSVMNEWKKGVKNTTALLDKNIGYLRVPSMNAGSREQYDKKSQGLNDSLCVLLSKGVKGIVLDLRLNGGGAMYPMMLGLQQLLGSGKLGLFNGNKPDEWVLKNNSFRLTNTIISTINPSCSINAEAMPVVLLTGPETGSSGEFLVMAFKGRPNTVLLGNTTAGYITVINGMPVGSTAYLYLSVGYGIDRNGKMYTEAIEPDITFDAVDKFNDIPNDEKVKAAANWLKQWIK